MLRKKYSALSLLAAVAVAAVIGCMMGQVGKGGGNAPSQALAQNRVRETYDGPLSMATDNMVWNIRRDEIVERMAVITEDEWSVPALEPPPARTTPPVNMYSKEIPNSDAAPPSPFPLTRYDTGDFLETIWTRDTLTGNWNFAALTRNELAEAGVTFKLQATQVAQLITRGGASTNNGLQYSGSADYILYLDTTRFTKGLWPGGMWTLHGETQWGRSVNSKVGSLGAVNYDALLPLPDEPGESTLSEFYLTQFFSPKFGVIAGKMDLTTFADTNGLANSEKTQFLNTALRVNPAVAPFAPYTALAVGLILLPTENLQIASIVADTNGTVTRTGFDSNGWFHSPRGTSFAHEWKLQVTPFGLPGTQVAGVAYSNKRLTDLNLDPRFGPSGLSGFKERPDDWVFWYNFHQYLYTDPQDQKQGFGVFGRFGYSTGKSNLVERFYSVGLGGEGVIPDRDLDRYGVGYYYIDISDDLPDILGIDDEQGIEVFYNVAVTPWMTVTPDVQYIIQPAGGIDGRRNAFVLGARIQMEF